MGNRILSLAVCFVVTSFSAIALQPPTAAQLERYKKEGTLKQRMANAQKFANHQLSPALAQKSQQYIAKQLGHVHNTDDRLSIIPGHRGMRQKVMLKHLPCYSIFPMHRRLTTSRVM